MFISNPHLTIPHLGKGLSLSEQVEQFGDHLLALARVHMRLIEHTCLLQDQALFNSIERRVFNCKARKAQEKGISGPENFAQQ
jgi:hypothetical protein